MKNKQPSRHRQQTANKVFLVRLKTALRKASNTELEEIAICVQTEYNRRSKK